LENLVGVNITHPGIYALYHAIAKARDATMMTGNVQAIS